MSSSPTSMPQQQLPTPQQHSQGLPSISNLTNGLSATSHPQQLSPGERSQRELRDSGTWPQPNTKPDNNQGLQVHTLLNPDDSPSRNSIPNTPQSARIPISATSNGSQLPSINQGFAEAGNRGSTSDYAPVESRRSSVDSRMHQGFNNLYINHPASPYESANASQVSLAASLRRPNGGAPMSPMSGRSSLRGHHAPRIAPPIMPVGRMSGGPDPTAAKPTQGYAWAFPDGPIPEERRTSDDSDGSSIGGSRTNSFAASSIRSSIFSQDSFMPPGQRRFDDESATTHHHTMQHRTIASLQNENLAAGGVGNYSRTPELRVSHKLAERKRRSEMKDLFEELNKAVPSNGGTKASKWEILTKAIEYIRSTQHTERNMHNELQRLQGDSNYAREAQKEIEILRTEIQVMHQHLRRLDPNAPHVYGQYTAQLNHNQAAQSHQANGASAGGISLPPLNTAASAGGAPQQQSSYGNAVAPHPPPGAMQGVEYGSYAR